LVGPFLFGGNLSVLDLSLAPKLYHMSVTLAKYQPQTLPKVSFYTSSANFWWKTALLRAKNYKKKKSSSVFRIRIDLMRIRIQLFR
jgi:hypothetical protein